MKKLLTIAALFIGLAVSSQNAAKTKDGNYIAVSHSIGKDSAKATGKTYTDTKGNVYPVMVSGSGISCLLYVWYLFYNQRLAY